MKRFVAVLFVILALGSCKFPGLNFHSFDEVSRPYLNQYGAPEEVNKYDSGNYHSVDWWWWTKGFEVSFLDSPYDEVNGWTVDSTYSFSPIP